MRDATEFYVIFDGPPGPEAGRFIEVETSSGESVRVGEWTRRSDGLWALGPFVETSHCSALARECERLRNELVDALRLLQWLHYAGYDADAPGRYANDRALRLSGAIHAAQVALGEASPPALGEGDAMSRVIQPCLDCPGVRYEGEPCRSCGEPYSLGDTGICFDCTVNNYADNEETDGKHA